MPQIGPAEIMVVLLVALIVLGPTKLPQVARQVGKAMRDVREFQQHVRAEIDDLIHHDGSEEGSDATDDDDAADAAPNASTPALPAGPDAARASAPKPGAHAPSRFRSPNPPPAGADGVSSSAD